MDLKSLLMTFAEINTDGNVYQMLEIILSHLRTVFAQK